MKTLFQINVVANSGSTGRIAEELGCLVMAAGWKSYIAYGRWACPSQSQLIRIGTKFDNFSHAVWSFLFDRHGLGSIQATRKLITQIERIKPDIIHLHNVHGYYLNYKLLFKYLSITGIPVVWTLHDCWSMTGHCVHFQNIGCEKWLSLCQDCPNKHDYPKSLFLDNSRPNYLEKKETFTSAGNLTVIPVCNWLDDIVSRSFLNVFPRYVITNGIDLEQFTPDNSRNKKVREDLSIGSHFMLLGVATVWSTTKGLEDIFTLRKLLPQSDVIVLIGLTKKQIRKLPVGIIGIEHTEDVKHLACFYSEADVFINPTYQDTLPTVSMEALACGTPVVTYDTGGSMDIVSFDTGFVIERGDISSFYEAVNHIKRSGRHTYTTSCRNRAMKYFNKSDRYKDYLQLYNRLIQS